MSKGTDHSPGSAERPGPRRIRRDQISGDVPGSEADGGESIVSGRSRERHGEVPDEVELPPPDSAAKDKPRQSRQEKSPSQGGE